MVLSAQSNTERQRERQRHRERNPYSELYYTRTRGNCLFLSLSLLMYMPEYNTTIMTTVRREKSKKNIQEKRKYHEKAIQYTDAKIMYIYIIERERERELC